MPLTGLNPTVVENTARSDLNLSSLSLIFFFFFFPYLLFCFIGMSHASVVAKNMQPLKAYKLVLLYYGMEPQFFF